jgi:hypothetical protein
MRRQLARVAVVTPDERDESNRREVMLPWSLEHTGHTSPLSKHFLMSLSRWFGAAFAVVTLTRPALGQAKADSVSLRFAWPVGMTARVDQEWTRMQIGPVRNDSFTVRSRWRLTVSAHPKGRLIQYDQFTITSLPPATPNRRAGDLDPQQLLARLGSVQPSYVVSTDGEFLGIEGVDRTKRVLDSLLAPMMREMAAAAAPPALKTLMENATSVRALTAAAGQDWNATAGTWVGADWEVGAAYEMSSEEPSPMIPGFMVPMRMEFSAAERVPCTDRETARRCIRLEMISEPDSAALRKAVTDFVATLAPKDVNVAELFGSMRLANELTVVADPRDLRPYFVELVKAVEIQAAAGPNEPAGRTRRVDIRTARYTYIK